MSTRSIVTVIIDGKGSQHFYRHHDGYEAVGGADLAVLLTRAHGRPGRFLYELGRATRDDCRGHPVYAPFDTDRKIRLDETDCEYHYVVLFLGTDAGPNPQTRATVEVITRKGYQFAGFIGGFAGKCQQAINKANGVCIDRGLSARFPDLHDDYGNLARTHTSFEDHAEPAIA